jgi:hypothetical protein
LGGQGDKATEKNHTNKETSDLSQTFSCTALLFSGGLQVPLNAAAVVSFLLGACITSVLAILFVFLSDFMADAVDDESDDEGRSLGGEVCARALLAALMQLRGCALYGCISGLVIRFCAKGRTPLATCRQQNGSLHACTFLLSYCYLFCISTGAAPLTGGRRERRRKHLVGAWVVDVRLQALGEEHLRKLHRAAQHLTSLCLMCAAGRWGFKKWRICSPSVKRVQQNH